ncbi:hypothetical protein OUZ56_023715 [Daphnia magna]|uniref:Uncharacterized protein n=1 Tax=Daphnia magna TaxID=35525 RepID=A0ABR0AZM0_9CRUS|nr:hypothetical protein OUZ56_023715 [Daphnia magna]
MWENWDFLHGSRQVGRARRDEAYGKAAPSLLGNRERHLSSRRRLSSADRMDAYSCQKFMFITYETNLTLEQNTFLPSDVRIMAEYPLDIYVLNG